MLASHEACQRSKYYTWSFQSELNFYIQNFMHELAGSEIEIDYKSSGLMLDYWFRSFCISMLCQRQQWHEQEIREKSWASFLYADWAQTAWWCMCLRDWKDSEKCITSSKLMKAFYKNLKRKTKNNSEKQDFWSRQAPRPWILRKRTCWTNWILAIVDCWEPIEFLSHHLVGV